MLGTSPTQTFPVVLACDRATPRDRQPRWWLRMLSVEEWRAYSDVATEAEGLPAAESRAKLHEGLRMILAGWQNVRDGAGQPVRCGPEGLERLEELLTDDEAWELYFEGLGHCRLTDADRKNSASPSPAASGSSAAAGRAGGETA